MRTYAQMPVSATESSLGNYCKQIRHFSLLERTEEYRLARRWRAGDKDALDRLVKSHLRLVVKVAAEYRGYRLPISDLISEGTIGLMQAIERFDPDRGFRLSTYATWWIRASMQEYILRSWSLVRLGTTANERRLFFNLRKAKNKIFAFEEGGLRPDQVKRLAKYIGVPEQPVIEMNCRLHGDVSLNAPYRPGYDVGEWEDSLIDDRPSPEDMVAEHSELVRRRKALRNALSELSDRERHIFETTRLAEEPLALETLARRFDISRERVRQINVGAYVKIQQAVRNQITQSEPRAEPGRSLRPAAEQGPRRNRRSTR